MLTIIIASSINNQLTLLNVLRAMDGLPLHYTSVQRLTGSVSIAGTAGFNAQIKGSAPVATSSITDARAPTGTTLTDVISRAVTTGGNSYTPTVGASLTTGPSFDVNILDSQAFYQGILGSVPFSVVNDFIAQDYDNEILMALLIEEVDLEADPASNGTQETKDQASYRNWISFSDEKTTDEFNDQFEEIISCFSLESVTPPDVQLVPFSRMQSGKLTLADISQLDGAKLDLSAPLTTEAKHDSEIWIERPSSAKQMPHFVNSNSNECPRRPVTVTVGDRKYHLALPSLPPPLPTYVGDGQEMVLSSSGEQNSPDFRPAKMTVTFRSPEGVIRYLGACLHGYQIRNPTSPQILCELTDGKVIFALNRGTSPNAVVAASLLGQDYFIDFDPAYLTQDSDASDASDARNYLQTMATLGIIERLVDLQKAGTQAPATAPVQIVP